MKTVIASALFLGASFQLAYALPAASSDPSTVNLGARYFDGGPVGWEIQPFRNGNITTLYGTIEEVHAQLLGLNPSFDTDFPEWAEKHDGYSEDDNITGLGDNSTMTDLGKRTNFDESHATINCKTIWSEAPSPYNIRQGIKYLKTKVTGHPKMGAGSGRCGRVSCSYNSAIWWCNDAKTTKTLAAYSSIANGAQAIYSKCVYHKDITTGEINYVGGQAFHESNWNVIVREDKC